MKLEQFAMERMQSTYENLVDFNLSESGVRPLTPRELLSDRDGARRRRSISPWSTRSRTAPSALRVGRCRAVSRRDRRAYRGHQRRVRGQLHHDLATGRTRRRSRDAAPELHADMGPGAGLRRHDPGVAAGRRRAAGRWRADLDGARRPGDGTDEADRHLQSEQPYRRAAHRRRISTASPAPPIASAPGCCPTRSIAAPSSTGMETPSMWGRGERVIVTNGLSKAYGLPGLRIGWIAGAAGARRLDLVVSRLHHHRARRAQRPPGAGRARTRRRRRNCSNARAASCAPTCRCSRTGCARTATRSRGLPPRGGRDLLRAVPPRAQLDRAGHAAQRTRRACWSCPAITSAWTTTCASDSARPPDYVTAGLARLHELLASLAESRPRRLGA